MKKIIKPYEMNGNSNEKYRIIKIPAIIPDGETDRKDVDGPSINSVFNIILIIRPSPLDFYFLGFIPQPALARLSQRGNSNPPT